MLAAAAPASSDRRTFVLALIGNLICSWSNNESLFICVMILLQTDVRQPRRRVRDTEYDPRETRSDPATGQDQSYRPTKSRRSTAISGICRALKHMSVPTRSHKAGPPMRLGLAADNGR